MGSNLKILFCLFLKLGGLNLISGEICFSSTSCNDYPDLYCCTDNGYKCCTDYEYNNGEYHLDKYVNSNVESSIKLAYMDWIILGLVVCVLAVISCIVGCISSCRRTNARPGRILGPTVVTTTMVQSGQRGVHHTPQAGYHPGHAKMQYPAGPAPQYVSPGQQYAQPGMPPPYSAQSGYPSAGYQPMPALPPGQQATNPYPPQPMMSYPNPPQPAYAPGYVMQSLPPYPAKDGSQASAPSAF